MISIIIPAYNAEKYISRCIDSILNQTYTDYEVIIIDDGSMDKTKEVCEKYLENTQIRLIHKENGGSASARNLGLKNVKGEYIAFVDADDYIHPEYLNRLMRVQQEINADIVQCNYETTSLYNIKEINNALEYNVYTNIQMLERFCRKKTYLKTAVLWNKLYKAKLFNGLEFPIGKGIDDEFLSYKVIYNADKIAEINDCLYYYFMSDNSQMRSAPKLKLIDNIEAIENQLDFFVSIDEHRLYNMLLYRYYSSLSGGYRYVKKYFPAEKKILQELKRKNKDWYRALFIKETDFADKIILCVRELFPELFNIIHRKARK